MQTCHHPKSHRIARSVCIASLDLPVPLQLGALAANENAENAHDAILFAVVAMPPNYLIFPLRFSSAHSRQYQLALGFSAPGLMPTHTCRMQSCQLLSMTVVDVGLCKRRAFGVVGLAEGSFGGTLLFRFRCPDAQ